MVMHQRAGRFHASFVGLSLFPLLFSAASGLKALRPHGMAGVNHAWKELQHSLKEANATAAAIAPLQPKESTTPPPCACEAYNPAWKGPASRQPECLFIDLGASDGETFKVFQGWSSKWTFDYDTPGFEHSKCYSYLVEANPSFASQLESFRNHQTFPMPGVAAYMCDKQEETFYVDVGEKAWGSSLNSTHDSVKYNNKPIQVRLVNLMRLLSENAIPEDTVVVKMDVEGAEWDIIPCLSKSPAVKLIDTLYLESHCDGKKWCPSTGQVGHGWDEWRSALASIKQAGVHIPEYWSPL